MAKRIEIERAEGHDDILREDLIAALQRLPPGAVIALRDGRAVCFDFEIDVDERVVDGQTVTFATFVSDE